MDCGSTFVEVKSATTPWIDRDRGGRHGSQSLGSSGRVLRGHQGCQLECDAKLYGREAVKWPSCRVCCALLNDAFNEG